MKRPYTPGRWNYSQKTKKWVYVKTTKSGRRKYKYQLEPPKEFDQLSNKLRKLNQIQAETIDPDENMRIFVQMREITDKMQLMTQEED